MSGRGWRFALVAVSAVVFVSAGAGAPKPKGAGGEKYALLVGVREYDPNELRSLPYAEADVAELAQVLRDAGFGHVVLMTQAEGARRARLLPTAANIRVTLKGMLEDREPGDTVVVAFAGHGIQFRGGKESYFCPMDAKLAVRSTLVPIDEVYKGLEGSGAGVKLFLVDACRNDPQSDNSRSRSVVKLESVTRPQAMRLPGGVAAIFSCSPGERAFEHDRLKHGVFYNFVIQGLKGEADLDGDGQIGVEELALFTKRRVPDFVKEEYGFDVRQMPVLRGEVGGLAALTSPGRGPRWVALFNGKDLDGWEAYDVQGPAEVATSWRVEGGVLHSMGPKSHLFSPRGDYKDFRYRVELKINERGNSGMYFRTRKGPGFPKGYEAQVDSSAADSLRTGTLYYFVPVREILVPPDTWFTQEVEAVGNHIIIKVNGKTTVDFVDKDRTYSEGFFAFQQHDPNTHVQIRKAEVMELPGPQAGGR